MNGNDLVRTIHDLAADWSWKETYQGFRFFNGRVIWESAQYGNGINVRISRLEVTENGIRQINAYEDPNTLVIMIPREGEEEL